MAGEDGRGASPYKPLRFPSCTNAAYGRQARGQMRSSVAGCEACMLASQVRERQRLAILTRRHLGDL